jgi:hypothetical protein
MTLFGPKHTVALGTTTVGNNGFVLTASGYTTLSDPLQTNGGTSATGINDAGEIVGDYLLVATQTIVAHLVLRTMTASTL